MNVRECMGRRCSGHTIAILLVALGAGFASPCFGTSPSHVGERDKHDGLEKLHRAQAYSQIVARYRNYDWSRSQTPGEVAIYCMALVETGQTTLPPNLETPEVPLHIAKFARAIMWAHSGQVVKAGGLLAELTNNGESKAWGYLGLLFKMRYTENYTAMKPLLTQLSTLAYRYPWVREWALPGFRLVYHYHLAEYEQVATLLEGAGLDAPWYDDYAAMIHSQLLVRNNRFEQAHAVLDKAQSAYGETPVLIDMRAQLKELTSGLEVAIDYLAEKVSAYPDLWQVQMSYAYYLAASGRDPAIEKAAEIIMDVAKGRPFDIPTLITVEEQLLDWRDYAKASQIHKMLLQHTTDALTEFARYRFSLAKADYQERRVHSLRWNIHHATQMSPMEPEFLSFVYKLARANGNDEKALGALKNLLHIDPYGQHVLVAMMEMYTERAKWSDVKRLADRLCDSPRHMDAATRSKVRLYMDKTESALSEE